MKVTLLLINEESGLRCPEVVLQAKTLTLKDLLKIFHDIESSKGETFEADVTFQRSVTIHQGREKMPSSYYKLQNEKASIIQTTPKFFIVK